MRMAVLLLALTPGVAITAPPNVLVILADDQGWGDLSINGNTNLKTPHIDSLAQDGARFERFFVQPVCSPTRAEFLTGRYHPRGGVRNVSQGGERLNLNEITIADVYHKSGYRTACFGKWHNGSQYPYHPNGRGFQEYYGFTSGHWGEYFNAPLDRNGMPVKGQGFLADDMTDHAVQFIKRSQSQPFFCYVAYNTPHSPMQVPDPYWNRFKDKLLEKKGGPKEDQNHTRAALAMMENLDDNVGRLLKSLDESQLAENTIVVYFSDNGPNGNRWNGGMKGVKGSVDEGGVRSPLHIRWPGKIPKGKTISTIAGAIDLFPTLAALCDIPTPNNPPLDGISLQPTLLKEVTQIRTGALFQYWNGRLSVRTQSHRLDPNGLLFNMVNDPEQKKDIAKAEPAITAELQKMAEGWRLEVLKDFVAKDPRPFTVGYPQHPLTILPARDGIPTGGIQRSANAPNCSYFTKWTKPEDTMVWNVDIHTPGRYRLRANHTCATADVGAVIVASCGSATWTTTTQNAFDPPLRGMAEDRVLRKGESYVKDFQALDFGTAMLEKGTATFTLKAIKIPGVAVADIRSIELELLK